MTHAFYIGMSYATTGLVVLCLIAWVVMDGQARKRELKELEASGVRRKVKAVFTGDGK
ncbi:heme exporter protein CcmD [Agrobacterium tumefaciens]|uniref:Heme exporter protein D n=1 Tax=Agrobacterium tumefaciens TaxID=358 RepID=A0A176WU94_AGRTU|nr:heme exporter protein CcmD [Agrobacterium tumefaciens]OAE36802.1 heme exporter protein CcmD [Agrobacterium tumefaciens]